MYEMLLSPWDLCFLSVYFCFLNECAPPNRPNQVRELFKENVFLSKDPMSRMTLIDATLPKAVQADGVLRTLRREKREATADEQALIDEVEAAREIIIQVCTFFCSLRVCCVCSKMRRQRQPTDE